MSTTTKKRTRGRPRRERKTSLARLVARCTDAELRAAERTAEKLGETLSDFVRHAVAAAVAVVAGQPPATEARLAVEMAKWASRHTPGRE